YSPSPNTPQLAAGMKASGEPCIALAKQGRLRRISQDTSQLCCEELHFSHKPEWNMLVHTYVCNLWRGEPIGSEEMATPTWFTVSEIPYETMWPDDAIWLPEVLQGKLVKADFIFGENDVIQVKNVQLVSSF
ncbi:MAG: hypothetical protein Q8R25_01340, partial [bacterium]|nr:hypothetical protein [bacterium]